MKKIFWLLDINYEMKENKPELWIWGIDNEGKRILIIDRNFLSYFYLVLEEKANPQTIIEAIQSQKANYPSLVKLEGTEKKFFGKPVETIKVVVQNPDLVSKYSKDFKKLEGVKDCLENDIRYSMRYLIDHNVVPCGWHEIEVTEAEKFGVRADKVYLAKSFPKATEKTELPQLRILAISTIAYSSRGSPKPEKNPVVIVSTITNTGEEKQFVTKDFDDKPVLDSFIKYVQDFDPDIIVGYGTNRQNWPYLSARCKKLGRKLSVDRANTEPHTSVYGHVSLTGRANIDFFDFADELVEVKVKTLENVADFLDVMKIEKRTLIEDVDFAAYWDDSKKRSTLLKFSMENTQSVMGVTPAMLDFAMQLSSLVGLPLDHVGTADCRLSS